MVSGLTIKCLNVVCSLDFTADLLWQHCVLTVIISQRISSMFSIKFIGHHDCLMIIRHHALFHQLCLLYTIANNLLPRCKYLENSQINSII